MAPNDATDDPSLATDIPCRFLPLMASQIDTETSLWALLDLNQGPLPCQGSPGVLAVALLGYSATTGPGNGWFEVHCAQAVDSVWLPGCPSYPA